MAKEEEQKEEKKEEKEEQQEKPQSRFDVANIPTQTAPVVYDTESDQVWDEKKVQTEILNRLDRIESLLG